MHGSVLRGAHPEERGSYTHMWGLPGLTCLLSVCPGPSPSGRTSGLVSEALN